jgi:peptidoglycan/LPS O-acetylase OafA/YrhL
MIGAAGRRRRRLKGDPRRIAAERRVGGLVRWQGGQRRAGQARLAVGIAIAVAAFLLTLALIAARTAGWLHWGALWMLAPAAVLIAALGAGVVALLRRGLAWLAG